MGTLANAVAIFRDAIASRFPGAGGETDIAFELGTPFPVEGMGQAEANELMSKLANMVPVLTDAYCERGIKTVEGMYEILLKGSMARPGSSGLAIFELIKAGALRDFDLQEIGTLGVADKYHPVATTPHNWFDVGAAGNWSHQRIAASDEPPPTTIPDLVDIRLEQWWVVPDDDEELIAVLKRPLTLETMGTMQQELVRPRVTEPTVVRPPIDIDVLAGIDHLALSISANTLVREELLASPRFLSRARHRFRPEFEVAADNGLLLTDDSTHTQGPDDGGAVITVRDVFMPWEYTDIVVDRTDRKPIATRSMEIEFDLCVVSLRRDWLSDSFLVLQDWFVPTFRRAQFSKGPSIVDNRDVLLGAIPTACVLVRDVTIKATWTPEDVAVLDRSLSAGPFSLLGRTFDTSTGIITVPGVQAVAWVFTAPPLLPPLDDPTINPNP